MNNRYPRMLNVPGTVALLFESTFHAASCVASHGDRCHAEPVARVAECSIPLMRQRDVAEEALAVSVDHSAELYPHEVSPLSQRRPLARDRRAPGLQ